MKPQSKDQDEDGFVENKEISCFNKNEIKYIALFFRLELLPRQSYANRYRSFRDRYPGDTSPTRRTATVVRRVPESAIVEGKLY